MQYESAPIADPLAPGARGGQEPPGRPGTVVPPQRVTTRIEPLSVSVITKLPAPTATPIGFKSLALAAGPPSSTPP
jgi:hypothetical protein